MGDQVVGMPAKDFKDLKEDRSVEEVKEFLNNAYYKVNNISIVNNYIAYVFVSESKQ